MSKRGKVSPDKRKHQIITAAAAVFARKGFSNASMDDIVKESGLSKGGLYWHFKSKDDIITGVMEQFFSAEMVEIASILVLPGSAAGKIESLTSKIMADTVDQLSVYINIWLEFYAVAAREGAFRARLLGYMNQIIDLYTALIQQGIDDGEFQPANARALALVSMAQLEGLILLWAINPQEIEILQLSETAVNLFLAGLR